MKVTLIRFLQYLIRLLGGDTVPLLWTTKGNIPEERLRLEIQWEMKEEYVKVVLRHYDGEELVKEGAHILSLRGVTGEAVIGAIS